MTDPQPTIAGEVERYLRTGEADPHHHARPGGFLDRAVRADQDLRDALVLEVKRLAEGHAHRPLPTGDTVAFTRRKVAPMVRGLFPRSEQEALHDPGDASKMVPGGAG